MKKDGYISITDKIHVDVYIVAIVLGADESLLQLNGVDGFSFKKVNLDNFKYKDKILMANQEINNKYYLSQLQDDFNDINSSSFVCLVKEDVIEIIGQDLSAQRIIKISDESLALPELEEYQNNQFELINRIISKLQLLKVADIGIFELFYEFNYHYLFANNNRLHISTIEDAKTIFKKKYRIETNELEKVNDFLCKYNQPFHLMKNIIDGYTYSFKLLDRAKSFEQLISVLEIMYLPKDQKNKKATLSKRMAVFLGKDDLDIRNIYSKIKSFYKYRSDSIHEGIYDNIGEDELTQLKEFTRLSILKFLTELGVISNTTFDDFKKHVVAELVTQVKNKIDAGVLPE